MKTGRPLICAMILLMVFAANSAWAEDVVALRWVKASNTQMRGPDVRLKDVEPTLRKKLPYQSYQLLFQEKVELKGEHRIHLDDGFVLRVSGPQDKLRLIVERNDKEVLNTTVTLQDDKPLIVGGFPGGDDSRLMLVLKAK